MVKVGLLSDTHGDLDPKIFNYFKDVDEIWHAGDIGTIEVLDQLSNFKPTRAVFGNIDDHIIRSATKEFLRFQVEKVSVLMTHIAGRPGKYAKPAFEELQKKWCSSIIYLWAFPYCFGSNGSATQHALA